MFRKVLASLVLATFLVGAAVAPADARGFQRHHRGGGHRGHYFGGYGHRSYGYRVLVPVVPSVVQPTVHTPGVLDYVLGAALAPVVAVGGVVLGSETPVGPPRDLSGRPICDPSDPACAEQEGFEEGRRERLAREAVAAREAGYRRGLQGENLE